MLSDSNGYYYRLYGTGSEGVERGFGWVRWLADGVAADYPCGRVGCLTADCFPPKQPLKRQPLHHARIEVRAVMLSLAH
jgi:hypothetical protein